MLTETTSFVLSGFLCQVDRIPRAIRGNVCSPPRSFSGPPHGLDGIEFGMTNVSTGQVLDTQISGNRLVYRAYDVDDNKRDELVIEK